MSKMIITAFFNSLSQAEQASTRLRELGAEELNLIQYDVNDEQGEGLSDLGMAGAVVAASPNQGSGSATAMGAGGGFLALGYLGGLMTDDAGAESNGNTEVSLEGIIPKNLLEKATEIIEDHDGRL
jgi:hypothetical protein